MLNQGQTATIPIKDMGSVMKALAKELIQKGIKLDEALNQFELELLRALLESYKGNQSKAALAHGIHRNTMQRRLAKLKLSSMEFRK